MCFDETRLRAQVREKLGAPRSRQNAGEIEDADSGERRRHYFRMLQGLRSASTACAALCPGAPVTPPPGWAPDPQR